MKKIFLLIIALMLSCLIYISYFFISKNNLIENEILNFKSKKQNLVKPTTDFLDANYIRCATSTTEEKWNDTVYESINFEFKKIQNKWKEKFPKNNLDSVKSIEKVAVNDLSKIDNKNLYKLILKSISIRNKPFSKGVSINQKIIYKRNDTLKEYFSFKEFWWKNYKWEQKKNIEYQNSYFNIY